LRQKDIPKPSDNLSNTPPPLGEAGAHDCSGEAGQAPVYERVQSHLALLGAQDGDLVFLGKTGWTVHKEAEKPYLLTRATMREPGYQATWEAFLCGESAQPRLFREVTAKVTPGVTEEEDFDTLPISREGSKG
jgi:hypothetical protein